MKLITLVLLCVVFAFGAWAQSAPIVEASGQYQMLRVNSSRNFPAFTANGGTGSVAVNFFDYVSGVLEVGVVHNGDIQNYQINNNWLSYLLGPRFSLRSRAKKVIPALECLVGGTTVFASGTPQGTNTTLSANSTGFAMALGGTLDIKVNKTVMFRPIQLDYFLTRVNNSYNQNNLRYGAGIVFTFGQQ